QSSPATRALVPPGRQGDRDRATVSAWCLSFQMSQRCLCMRGRRDHSNWARSRRKQRKAVGVRKIAPWSCKVVSDSFYKIVRKKGDSNGGETREALMFRFVLLALAAWLLAGAPVPAGEPKVARPLLRVQDALRESDSYDQSRADSYHKAHRFKMKA